MCHHRGEASKGVKDPSFQIEPRLNGRQDNQQQFAAIQFGQLL
jgi:hypothetical protein